MPPKQVEETCKKIMTWLSEDGLYKDKVYDEKLYFHLAAEYPSGSGRHISVIQPNNRDDMAIVVSRIRLADVHEKALLAMPKKERDKFLWEMRYALLFRESSFQMEPKPDSLKSIQFSREIHYDGLTKNKLMEVIRENFKCELYVVWKFSEAFGEDPGPKHAENMYI
jgi:hypothetical protein